MKEACDHIDENAAKVSAMRDKLIAGLSKIPHSALNGDPVHRLPGNVSFCFEGIEGESLLLLLDAEGHLRLLRLRLHLRLSGPQPRAAGHWPGPRGGPRLSAAEPVRVEHRWKRWTIILKAVPRMWWTYLRSMSPVWRDLQTGKREFIL